MTADGFELQVSGDRGEASRTMRRLPGTFRVRARKASGDWYRGDLLELELRTDGTYRLRVRENGAMIERAEGHLDV